MDIQEKKNELLKKFLEKRDSYIRQFVGPRGEKGDTGENGPTGSTGPRGERGDTGPRGDAGKNGTEWKFEIGEVIEGSEPDVSIRTVGDIVYFDFTLAKNEIVRGSGGISKSAVVKLIEEMTTSMTTLESSGGTVIITPIENGYNLEVAGAEPVITPLDITSFTGGSTNEIGSIVSSVNLAWTYNKPVTSQSINQGIGSLPIDDRAYAYSTPISANTTFTLSGVADTTSDTANTSVTFISRRYWGVTTSGVELLEAEIEAESSELNSSKAKSITFNCTGGRRIFYAYPVSYGLATVRDGNGFLFNDFLTGTAPYEVTLINSYGYSQSYYVYHSFNIYNSATVQFSWS